MLKLELDRSHFPFEPEDFVIDERVPATIAEYRSPEDALPALDYWDATMVEEVHAITARHKAEVLNGAAHARVDEMFAEMGIAKEKANPDD
jgi:hypothetical protein